MSDNEVAEVLAERGKRYGDFSDHARVTQALKRIIHSEIRRRRALGIAFSDDMVESLEMDAHKTGRILCGDPFYRDSWVDKAGCAMLVAERLVAERPET